MKKLGPLMYWNGKGELITRTEYMRWKFRNNQEEKISVDESGMTQFDPLLSWEDHDACWKMQYRGSLGESLLHILIMGNSLIHTKIARTLIRQFPRTVIDVIEVLLVCPRNVQSSAVLLTTDCIACLEVFIRKSSTPICY